MRSGHDRLVPALAGNGASRWRFGPFVLDAGAMRLQRGEQTIALAPRAYDVLLFLVRHAGQVVLKDQLLDGVWGHEHLTEGVVKNVINTLREALDDDARAPRWIETVARRGYRFIGAVEPAVAAVASVPPSPVGNAGAANWFSSGQLPPSPGPLIGRSAEVAELQRLLDSHALVTVIGPGGVGKSRLSLEVARDRQARHRDGAWLLELAPLSADTSAQQLREAIAFALHLDAEAAASTAKLADRLQPLDAVVVIDNAEHVVEALASVMADLRAKLPSTIRFLVTSQEPLRIEPEQVWRLMPLAVPDEQADGVADLENLGAVQLFVQRAAQRLEGFALTPHQQRQVGDICRALDGLPLALELAAACIPMLGVHGLHQRLSSEGVTDIAARLSLPGGRWRGVPQRQRSLRDALLWSHALLNPLQQVAFRRLAVFRGSFSADDAQAVIAGPPLDAASALDCLQALVDKSLLDAVQYRHEVPVGPHVAKRPLPEPKARLRLLEGPRELAMELLRASGEVADAACRHAAHFLALCERQERRAEQEPLHRSHPRWQWELDNLRTVLKRASEPGGDVLLAAALMGSSAPLWVHSGRAAEGAHWCEVVRLGLRQGPHPEAKLHHALARLAMAEAYLGVHGLTLEPAHAEKSAADAAGYFLQHADPIRAYRSLHLQWTLLTRREHDVCERRHLVDAMSTLEAPDWPVLLTRLRRAASAIELRLTGQSQAYVEACRQELSTMRRLRARAEMLTAAQALMQALNDAGFASEARDVGRETMGHLRASGHLRAMPTLLLDWLALAAPAEPLEQLQQVLAQDLALLMALGLMERAAPALAWIALRDGRPDDAAMLRGFASRAPSSGAGAPSPIGVSDLASLDAALQKARPAATLSSLMVQGAGIGPQRALTLAMPTAS